MGRKRFEREYGISEEQLLEQTLQLITTQVDQIQAL
jgi:hypothetical protein